METVDKLINDFQKLDKASQSEIIDFVEFLKQKHEKKLSQVADDIFNQYDDVFKELAK